MIFIAHSLHEKDDFLAKARELLGEDHLKVRFSGSRWVVTVSDVGEATEWELQKWIRKLTISVDI